MLRILIIDDDRLNSEMLRDMTNNIERDVICAFTDRLNRSCTEAATVFSKTHFSCKYWAGRSGRCWSEGKE